MARILLLNGPNLNRLGTREPDIYGQRTLPEIEQDAGRQARKLGHELTCVQSNSEAELIGAIESAADTGVAFILFNPAAFTHSSIALRDALLGAGIPFVEIHLSNVHGREPFRQHSYFSDIAAGCISGFGPLGYELALRAAAACLERDDGTSVRGKH